MRVKRLLIGLCAAAAGIALPGSADDYLSDKGTPIAKHERQRSPQTFVQGSADHPQFLAGVVFSQDYWKSVPPDEQGIVHYRELPRCTEDTVALTRIYNYTPGTESFDVVYYDESESSDLRKSKAYRGTAVAYRPALVQQSPNSELPRWQVFARFVQIDCLPTRFRFSHIGNKRFIEYRKGTYAWNERYPPEVSDLVRAPAQGGQH